MSCFPIFKMTKLRSEKLLGILVFVFRQRNTSALVLAMEAREGPTTQDRDQHPHPSGSRRPRCDHSLSEASGSIPVFDSGDVITSSVPRFLEFLHRYFFFSWPCTYLVELELEFPVRVHSEALNGSWRWYTAYPFTPVNCVVFEVVVCRRTCTDVVIRPLGGRTGAAPFFKNFNWQQPQKC